MMSPSDRLQIMTIPSEGFQKPYPYFITISEKIVFVSNLSQNVLAILILSELNSVSHFSYLNQKSSGILILSESKGHFNFLLVKNVSPFFYLTRLIIENVKRKKNAQLTPSINLSSMTTPDYWKVCPKFQLEEIQFHQSLAWTWFHLRASHYLWCNERPGICNLLIFP